MPPVAPNPDPVAAYKTILRDIIDRRPSGTRQRLADALATNRSFVTQITNPSYPVPVPAQHLATIFRVCHPSTPERERFLAAYQQAHPGKLVGAAEQQSEMTRVLHLVVPDLGSAAKNRSLDRLLRTFATNVAEIVAGPDDTLKTQQPESAPARRRTRS